MPVKVTHPKASLPACLACRSKHQKCDGQKPVCRRCQDTETSCVFVPSRRGINMIESSLRNKRLKTACTSHDNDTIDPDPDWSLDRLKGPSPQTGVEVTISTRNIITSSTDSYILMYYQYIHPAHPFLLPRKVYLQNPTCLPTHLQAAMRFMVAHLTSEDPILYRQQANNVFGSGVADDEFKVQTLLVLTMISFARFERDLGSHILEQAVDLARRIGMGTAALGHVSCPIRQDSWRRTCAELATISSLAALFANSPVKLGFPFDMTLPCPDKDYEIGRVTPQKTFGEMQNRILVDEVHIWSSLAYEIEAVRILNTVLNISNSQEKTSSTTTDTIDASIANFMISIPAEQQDFMKNPDDIDEKMFSALVIINLACIVLHFPHSGLSQIQSLDSTNCTSVTAQSITNTILASKAMHTHRVSALRAANTISRLLTTRGSHFLQPSDSKLSTLSPCLTCAVALCVAVQLPSYQLLNSSFADKESSTNMLSLKENIHLGLNVLTVIGKKWPVARLVRGKVSSIAREVLMPQSRFSNENDTTQSVEQELEPGSEIGKEDGEDQTIIQSNEQQWLRDLTDIIMTPPSSFATGIEEEEAFFMNMI